MINPGQFVIMSGTGNHDLAQRVLDVVNGLGFNKLKFNHLSKDSYQDGEDDTSIEKPESLHGKDLVFFQSIFGIPLLLEFLQIVWAAKFQYGARSVTAVLPFFIYRRQDHPEIIEEIYRNQWLVAMMKASGVDRVLFCDVHSQRSLQNCAQYGIEAYNVIPSTAFAEHLSPLVETAHEQGRKFYVYAPDEGALVRAVDLAKTLKVKLVATLKRRDYKGDLVIYKDLVRLQELSRQHSFPIAWADKRRIKGHDVCVRDDELATGSTAHKTGWYARKHLGANKVFFCASSAVCAPGWRRKFLRNTPFDHAFLGNCIPRDYPRSTGGHATTVHVSRPLGNQLFKIMAGIPKAD
ncbi:MAG: hypothetical protein C3F02_03040 [Parcubacteria group bacterium]|nr:MAG: hypothetical protein C3F02_03040 [Parcubacteria group bacterium]